MKIAIIGHGFTGLATAWHLLSQSGVKSEITITLFDTKPIGTGTSGIAAGLLHPFAGAHAKLNWKGREGCAATQALIHHSESALGKPVTAPKKGILRLALTHQQTVDFKLCAAKYSDEVEWLEEEQCQAIAKGCAKAPGIYIKNGQTVYAADYLKGLWIALSQKGVQLIQKRVENLNELNSFDLIVVCAGGETLKLQELSTLPLKVVKGQVLELLWPQGEEPLERAINSKLYLLMTQDSSKCLLGATYERETINEHTDLDVAVKELLPKGISLFPPLEKAKVIRGFAGLRISNSTHRPLIQQISERIWVYTAMGSKGLLYHALFAQDLVKQIIQTGAL